VEGLLGAFHKLVDAGRDHTFIETETVRYVYQPMDTLYLVLVTNKASNILEDRETLRLLGCVVQNCCSTRLTEEVVLKNALDIVFAFDEVVSFGHRESTTISQIKACTEMDSHEEKLHQMIQQSKVNEANELAMKKQKELSKQHQAARKYASSAFAAAGAFGSDSVASAPARNAGDDVAAKGSPSHPAMASAPEIAAWTPSMSSDTQATIVVTSGPRKSMVLKKKKPAIHAGLDEPETILAESATQESAALLSPVRIGIKERIVADLAMEGGLTSEATCSGTFEVTVLDPAQVGLVGFKLSPSGQDFKYRVHPSLCKASFAQHILEVQDGVSAFPSGGCLRWQMKTRDDNFLPVTMACWPTPSGDGTEMVIDLELTDLSATLENVTICFPVSNNARPNVERVSLGEAAYKDGKVIWFVPVLDSSEGGGTLRFTASDDVASMLPATFEAAQSIAKCPTEIMECYSQDSKEPVKFACEKRVTYELKIGA